LQTILADDSIQQQIYRKLPHLSPTQHQHQHQHLSSSLSPATISPAFSFLTLPSYIDHSTLKADALANDIFLLCDEAINHQFYSVCVNGYHVARAKKYLQQQCPGTHVPWIATVIGFPLGASTSISKTAEACDLISCGADELDMVINIGALKYQEYAYVLNDIKSITHLAHQHHIVVKVILETGLLNDEQLIDASLLSVLAEADFLKTSTGFSAAGGTSIKAVKLMKAVVKDVIGIKASGGITGETAKLLIEAGATRLGMTDTVNIVKQWAFAHRITY